MHVIFRFRKIRCNSLQYVQPISTMLKDLDLRVQKIAMDSLVELYSIHGQALCNELSKFKIPASKRILLKRSFEEVDRIKILESKVRYLFYVVSKKTLLHGMLKRKLLSQQ